VDVGSNPPPITGFLTKEGRFGLLLVYDEIKEVYFNYRLPETRGFAENRVFVGMRLSVSSPHFQFVKYSNI
jgi:hypothetical protein